MPYIFVITEAGRTRRYQKYYTSRYGIKGIPRQKNRNQTTDQQAAVNLRKACWDLTGILNENFYVEDAHIVLDYQKEKRPSDWEEMRKDIEKCFRKLRREMQKTGEKLKYIHVMEMGSKGARHHHLVTNCTDLRIWRACWPKGRVHINPLDPSGHYEDLANYLLKYSDGAVRRGEIKKRWYPSRGLRKPKVTKKVIPRRRYKETVTVPKGYYLHKDSVRSYTDAFGNKGFTYTVIRTNDTS